MNAQVAGYTGTVIAMGTMHGKERQVAPAFAAEFGARVFAPPGIDTDQFGTFTGEVTRTLTPVAAATAKARLAMTAAKVPYGVASEASYDTWYGMLAMHQEILVFIDDNRGIHVVEGVNVPRAPGPPKLVENGHEAIDAARRFGFPEQGAVVTATIAGSTRLFGKGLTDAFVLVNTVNTAAAASDDHRARLEPDLRAHHNPGRREVLSALAKRLAGRLATPCPNCLCPGYGRVAVREGLRCRACGSPTTLVASDILGCPACVYRSEAARTGTAEPRYCPQCNP
ncbi:DUF6671 family protein [Mycobacterium camsae]|uniref:DUF6671 family protein n=1 Tax=Mycobacterium gordonae TaxID=1778 RepID=UPI00197F57C9|nr:DUF6671 family protein [Mycobacterium gordonae]